MSAPMERLEGLVGEWMRRQTRYFIENRNAVLANQIADCLSHLMRGRPVPPYHFVDAAVAVTETLRPVLERVYDVAEAEAIARCAPGGPTDVARAQLQERRTTLIEHTLKQIVMSGLVLAERIQADFAHLAMRLQRIPLARRQEAVRSHIGKMDAAGYEWGSSRVRLETGVERAQRAVRWVMVLGYNDAAALLLVDRGRDSAKVTYPGGAHPERAAVGLLPGAPFKPYEAARVEWFHPRSMGGLENIVAADHLLNVSKR